MRLQEVLKEREAEITILEESLKERDGGPTVTPPILNTVENDYPKANGISMSTDNALSPKTLNQFDHIRKGIENGNGAAVYDEADSEMAGNSEADESLERLNELMLYVVTPNSIVICTNTTP
jgi:hypothetical protein